MTTRVSEEARKKISASLTGRKQSLETIAKRVLKLRGQKRSPEQRDRISRSLIQPDTCSDCRTARERKRELGYGKDLCTRHNRLHVYAWRQANLERFRGHGLKYRLKEDVREYTRERHYRKKYGITIEQYDEMLCRQGGVCAICKRPPKEIVKANGVVVRRFNVDHCHASGRVRGLLCFSCNKVRVGGAQDNEALLYTRIGEYLADEFDGRLI